MNRSGPVDYHLHTAVTVDAHMTEDEACQRAIAQGVREIAFTNHVMLRFPNYCIGPQALVDHWTKIQACQARYPELIIRFGLEVDYYEGQEDTITTALRRYEGLIARPFDYILGSIHYMHGVFFSSSKYAPALFDRPDTAALYRDYFALQAKAVRSGLFDVMAHPDLIKKYTGRFSPAVPFDHYRASAEAFVSSLLETGVGIEVNPKGLKYSVAEIYPSGELLSLYVSEAKARRIQPIITLGSDAHRVNDVGVGLAEGVAALHRARCTTLSRFEQRRRMAFQLET